MEFSFDSVRIFCGGGDVDLFIVEIDVQNLRWIVDFCKKLCSGFDLFVRVRKVCGVDGSVCTHHTLHTYA